MRSSALSRVRARTARGPVHPLSPDVAVEFEAALHAGGAHPTGLETARTARCPVHPLSPDVAVEFEAAMQGAAASMRMNAHCV